MSTLSHFKHASTLGSIDPDLFSKKLKVKIVTNFTDDALRKIFTGMALEDAIYPTVYTAPYKQYQFELKNTASQLYQTPSNISFFFFDAYIYSSSEFLNEHHFNELLSDLERYVSNSQECIVVQTFLKPLRTSYENLYIESPQYKHIESCNAALHALAQKYSHIIISDTNRIMQYVGEKYGRDWRGMHAFDSGFSHEFLEEICREWLAYARCVLGDVRKCIVVDLDNTLWGGILGEVGARGIALDSTTYPGTAYQSFQKLLLDYYNRGVILAINSRNSWEDVAEVFEKNPHMILKEKHFAAIRTNWNQKHENILDIANELNIGLSSMVFIDDDPFNRSMVREHLPEVLVPELVAAPEQYGQTLLNLKAFHQATLTEEDLQKGKMYAQERQRVAVSLQSKSLDDYIAQLGISIDVSVNQTDVLPRLSQLTQKTNQFNLTTHRYTETDLESIVSAGGELISGTIIDTYGNYGTAILAIVKYFGTEAVLDSFLMSCRVAGRGVESWFLDYVVDHVKSRGITVFKASYIPTLKNAVIKDLLPSMGFAKSGVESYECILSDYKKSPDVNNSIVINGTA